jgi:hypothetical protein
LATAAIRSPTLRTCATRARSVDNLASDNAVLYDAKPIAISCGSDIRINWERPVIGVVRHAENKNRRQNSVAVLKSLIGLPSTSFVDYDAVGLC